MNQTGYWPYTPNTNLLYALSESLDMLLAEGLDTVFARHQRWAAGVRAAVQAWRSEEHTSELQSPCNLVCRLLLEKKKYARDVDAWFECIVCVEEAGIQLWC